ncbi:MAG: RCC1 domain-containing protein [Actinomycetota bacterium]
MTAPALRDGGTMFTAIAAGAVHSLALDDNGNLYGVGDDKYGQATPPALRDGGTTFTAIAAGYFHSLALDDKGNLYTFGWNGFNQVNAPALRGGGTKFTAINAGWFYSLALDDRGNLYTFGDNRLGQLNAPTLRDGGTKFTAISGGFGHSLALDDKGNLYTFGWNGYGQLNVPAALSAAYLRTMPIAAGGTNAYGIDENGIVNDFVRGYTILDDTEMLSIATGTRHGLGITRSGQVVGWGDGTVGQLEIPDGLGTVIQVGAGYSYSAARRADGSVVEWGAHTAPTGQLIAKPDDLPKIVSLAGGTTHIVGLTETGTVVSWGNNQYGRATPPEGLSDVIAIAASALCSVALSRDGTLTWWGQCHSETEVVTSLPGATAIALTDLTAAAIVDGEIRTWGPDANDELAGPEGSDWAALSAGAASYLAVDKRGNVATWGNNSYETITSPEMFGGPAPVIHDGICGDCAPQGPITYTDEDLENDAAFYVGILPKEQRDKFITALGGSTTKPLTSDEIQALIDAASAKARADALAEMNAARVDPATTPAATLPPAQNPTTKIGTTITTRKAVALLGLKKVTKVAFSVPKKASITACKITTTRITTVAAGTCNIKVAYTDSKKKKRTATLTLLIG